MFAAPHRNCLLPASAGASGRQWRGPKWPWRPRQRRPSSVLGAGSAPSERTAVRQTKGRGEKGGRGIFKQDKGNATSNMRMLCLPSPPWRWPPWPQCARPWRWPCHRPPPRPSGRWMDCAIHSRMVNGAPLPTIPPMSASRGRRRTAKHKKQNREDLRAGKVSKDTYQRAFPHGARGASRWNRSS
jgi:hypothetical protein